MAKLKFGSPAWRKKYAAKAKRNRAKNAKKRPRKPTYRGKKKSPKRNKPNTYTKKGAAAKRKRLKEMIRSNPPRNWTKVKAVRVVRKGGRDVLEIRK